MASTILHYEKSIDNRYHYFLVAEPFSCTICIYGCLGDILYLEASESLSFSDTAKLISGCFSPNSNINTEIKKVISDYRKFNEIRFTYQKNVIAINKELADEKSISAIWEEYVHNDPYYLFKRYKAWEHDLNSIFLNQCYFNPQIINY